MKTRLVLFDIDGTLIRTGGAGVKAFARTAEVLFGCPGGTEGLRFHGRTDVSLVREFLRVNSLVDSPENVARFLEVYVHLLDNQLRHHRGEICPGVGVLLEALRQSAQAPVLGLLTGNIRLGAGLKLGAHGLADAFLFGAFGDDHEDRNELARIALKRGSARLGGKLEGGEIVVVGDTRADIECARAIGARCVAVATGMETLPELLEHSPALAVESLASLSVDRLLQAGRQAENQTNWEELYRAKDTRWDKGAPAPGLVDFLAKTPGLSGQRVLIPGCGRGHDARVWAEAGCEVLGLDLAPTAVAEARAGMPPELRVTFELADYLDEPPPGPRYDWVFEHTLWCAIAPVRRGDYVRATIAALRPGGHYLALNYLQPADEAGPPFGITIAELRNWFEPDFILIEHWLPRSFPSRAGRERMFLWRRRS